MSKRSKRYLLPAKLAFLYNLGTLTLFLITPWNYQVTNYGDVVLLVVSCNVAMYLGYWLTVMSHRTPELDPAGQKKLEDNDASRIRLLLVWTIIAAVFALPDLLYNSRMWTLSPSELIGRLIIGLRHSEQNYATSLHYVDSGTILERVVVLVDVFIYFFKFAVLPLTLFYWGKVGKLQKILCIYVVGMELATWLLKGMNKGIFDVAFVFMAAAFLAAMDNGMYAGIDPEKERKRKIIQKVLIISGVALIAAAVVVFVLNARARTGRIYSSYYSWTMGLSADRDNFLLKLIPPRLHAPALDIDMYLTNGYQGLSYALRLPFKWCCGLGNNQFLTSNFRDAFGFDVTDISYLTRIEQVFPWQADHNWHTIYTWLANDIPFCLLPLLFLVYGVVFAAAWIDSLENHNPYAILIYCFFVVRIAYMSANNQVLSLSHSFIAWYITLFMWICSKSGKRVKIVLR